MPLITLRFRDIKIRDYPIVIGQTYTIGRKHSNDIVIDNPAVSGSHARVESVSTTFVLRDLDSTNGTFFNNEKITLHNLRHNDVIIIGNHKLAFDFSDMANVKPTVPDSYEVDKTRIFDASAYRDLSQKSVNNSTGDASAAGDSLRTGEKSPSFFSRLLKKIFG